jgi:hypothetical protein
LAAFAVVEPQNKFFNKSKALWFGFLQSLSSFFNHHQQQQQHHSPSFKSSFLHATKAHMALIFSVKKKKPPSMAPQCLVYISKHHLL